MPKIYLLAFTEDTIDFNSNLAHPIATFNMTLNGSNQHYLTKCVRPVNIKYKAMISGNINIITKKLSGKITKYGKLSFEIPMFTIGLEVTLTAHNSCKDFAKVVGYFPDNCKPDFILPMISTRLMIRICNQMAIDTTGLDHKPVAIGENRIFGHQLGPCRASRAMAIIHIAMFEALNAIVGGYVSYLNLNRASLNASVDAAIAQAAHDATVAMFPSHAPRLDAILLNDLAQITNGAAKIQGIAVGVLAAQTIVALRANDGSNHAEPVMGIDYIPSNAPGEWRQDPIGQQPTALGALWSQVAPFVIPAANTYRCPAPPALNSIDYEMAFDEVKALGGDGTITPTMRSELQTHIGIFWAYDGTPSLCAPPRLYNQAAMQIANQQSLGTIETLRMLVMINVAMADTALACWESKYFYKLWRPVTAIRESDVGTGPSGLGDGNANTIGDIGWTPNGVPLSNLVSGLHVTPNFPTLPSGHGSFGGCLFQTFRHIYGKDNISFTFVSDEFNGVTKDAQGNVRPYEPRVFANFSQAEDENGDSRIYLGIHFKFDKTYAIALGRSVADDVFAHLYQPI